MQHLLVRFEKKSLSQDTVSEDSENNLRLEKLINIGISLSHERNHDKLMESILFEAIDLAHADAGTLYTLSKDRTQLHFQTVRTKSLNIYLGGTSNNPINIPPVNLYAPGTREPNYKNIVTNAVLKNETVVIDNAYDTALFDFSGTYAFDKKMGYHSRSFITIPLCLQDNQVIGALQLINAKCHITNDTIPFSDDVVQIISSLASQAAVALDNHYLLKEQEALFDGFFRLIAGAIDTKSLYTGGHCTRVPLIALDLASAVSASDHPYVKDFSLSDDEWKSFEIACWLHDCGKITTPEHVVDKATKLETIYNRIHEIRMRFEVLIRDSEIQRLQGLNSGGGPEILAQQHAQRVKKIKEDFQFIANCNIGDEFLSQEKIDRIHSISKQTWTRHLSDRLGLASLEAQHMESLGPEESLPTTEHILADKQKFIIPRKGRDIDPFSKNTNHVIKMDIPPNLYNYGEIYNLSISRGTLSPEERFKINDHVIQTLFMLDNLPFPNHLKNVIEYACGHHETIIGTGYPKKLTRDEMSIPARILAIADIYEALTASDRPYKKGKTVDEALKIMNFMKKDQHIDPDLFDIFINDGIWKQYAIDHLKPEQFNEEILAGIKDASLCL